MSVENCLEAFYRVKHTPTRQCSDSTATYLREVKDNAYKKTPTRMFIDTLFVITNNRKKSNVHQHENE